MGADPISGWFTSLIVGTRGELKMGESVRGEELEWLFRERDVSMEKVLLQSTEALIRSFVLLVGSYAGLILVLRISGKRTLSKMNAFDLVVTVALGSTLATISLSKDTALVQRMLVLTLLVLL